MKEMTEFNLKQTKASLDVWLDSYEDILFQVYTDDTIVDLVRKIDKGESVSAKKSAQKRIARIILYQGLCEIHFCHNRGWNRCIL